MTRNTIKLIKDKEKQYFLSELSEIESNQIMDAHKSMKLKSLTINADIICENIVLIGSKEEANYNSFIKYVAPLKGYKPLYKGMKKDSDKKVQYRDYTRSEEVQLVHAHLVSVCEDERTSAKTLLMAVKSKYLCIWYKVEK